MQTVAGFLDALLLLDESRHELVQAVRALVLVLGPVSEEVKYGGLLFSAGKPFCGIFPYARHVSLEFGAGASFEDRHGVLEGKGKLRRHIKLFSLHDIPGKHVAEYLAQAFTVQMAR